MGWELLRVGGHKEAGVGGIRRDGEGMAGPTKPVGYNTVEEIRRFEETLGRMAE